MTTTYIGIDPGKHTGVAVWDRQGRYFTDVITLDFFGALNFLKHYNPTYTQIVIEDATQNKPTFRRKGQRVGVADRMAQNVGSVKRDTQLLIEWCERHGFTVRKVKPDQSKLNAAAFKRTTKYIGRTSQHARDAAMLVYDL